MIATLKTFRGRTKAFETSARLDDNATSFRQGPLLTPLTATFRGPSHCSISSHCYPNTDIFAQSNVIAFMTVAQACVTTSQNPEVGRTELCGYLSEAENRNRISIFFLPFPALADGFWCRRSRVCQFVPPRGAEKFSRPFCIATLVINARLPFMWTHAWHLQTLLQCRALDEDPP